MGIRAIERLTGLNQRNGFEHPRNRRTKGRAFLDAKIRNVNADVIQADEIHYYCFFKAAKHAGGRNRARRAIHLFDDGPPVKADCQLACGETHAGERRAIPVGFETPHGKSFPAFDGQLVNLFRHDRRGASRFRERSGLRD